MEALGEDTQSQDQHRLWGRDCVDSVREEQGVDGEWMGQRQALGGEGNPVVLAPLAPGQHEAKPALVDRRESSPHS